MMMIEEWPRAIAARDDRAGTLLLARWYGCDFSTDVLNDALTLRDVCLGLTRDCGLQTVGNAFYQFSPQGVTGKVLLSESHLAIQTWPEDRIVTLDVLVADPPGDNPAKALQLYDALKERFQPDRESVARQPHVPT